MLGATQKQLFNTAVNPETGANEITGFKPYQPYSTDVNNYFAGYAPLQRQAQGEISRLGRPTQFAMGTDLAYQGGQNLMGTAAPAMAYGAKGAGYGDLGVAASQMGFGAGQAYENQATNPADVARYMSPYMQNVTDYQKSQAVRDFQMAQPIMAARSVGQGAFGGNRLALQQSEAQRGLMSQLQGIEATGAQRAFDAAQQAQQYRANLGLQGLGAGYQGLGVGLQGVQSGLQGVGTAQAGYQGAVGAGGTLGNIGAQQSQSDLARISLLNQIGGQMQGFEQGKINQGISNYATAQQYPMMQLGFMSNMLRGLPLQSTSTSTYQNPSAYSQIGGLAATGLGAYGAAGGFRNKNGGAIKVKKYDVGGSVRADLAAMDIPQLRQVIATTTSKEIREDAAELLVQKQAAAQAEQQMPQQQSMGLAAAPAPNMDGMATMAGGGIVAFSNGNKVKDPALGQDPTLGFGGEDTVSRYLDKFGYNKPSEEIETLKKQQTQAKEDVKDTLNQNFWQSIMMGGAKTMAGTSPNAFANIGTGIEEGLGTYAKGQKDYGDMLNKIRTGELDIAKLSATDRNHILERALGASRIEEEQKTRRQNAEIAAAARAQTAGLAKTDRIDKLLQDQYKIVLQSAKDNLGIDKPTEQQRQAMLQEAMVNVNEMLQIQNKPGLNIPKPTVTEVKPTTEAEYAKLPKGAHYVDPNGKTRIKG
jgi:hypothetical protein